MGTIVLTEQKKKMAMQLYASGEMTLSDIGRTIGVSHSVLSRWLNQQHWYVEMRKARGIKTPKKRQEINLEDIASANKNTDDNVFVIPNTLPGLNEIIAATNKTRYEGNKLKGETEEYICSCIKAGLGDVEPFENVVQVHIRFIEKDRRRDYDNVMAGQKFIMDALIKAGVIYNDGQAFVMPNTFEFGVDKEYPRVEVSVEPTEIKLPEAQKKRTALYRQRNNGLRYMSDGEIRQAYRLAADKKAQIKILAQLNAMSVRAVEEIVGV